MQEHYSSEFIEEVFSYLSNFQELGIDINGINTISQKQLQVIRKIQHIYERTKLFRDYKIVKLSPLDQSDTLLYVNALMSDLFPSKQKEITLLDEKLSFQGVSYSEAGVYYRVSSNQVIIDKIVIPEECSGYTISIIGHEKTHVLTFHCLDLVELFQGYLELFPTFIQKIILYELENTYGFTYISELDIITRMNDCKTALSSLYYARYLNANIHPIPLDQYVSNYCRIKAIDYLQAELFSELLLKEYIKNPDKMLTYLNLVLEQRISIAEFLERYQISLFHPALISTVKETTNKIKRLSIIP